MNSAPRIRTMVVGVSQVDTWQSRKREPVKRPFVYSWYHSATGKRGIGTIFVRSYGALVEWMEKWNRQGELYGWSYSIFDSSV